MECFRCHGLMILDYIVTHQDTSGIPCATCANCGLVLDPEIIYNMRRNHSGERARNGTRQRSKIHYSS